MASVEIKLHVSPSELSMKRTQTCIPFERQICFNNFLCENILFFLKIAFPSSMERIILGIPEMIFNT